LDLLAPGSKFQQTLKIHFIEPVTFGFFIFQRPDGPRLMPNGLSLILDGARFSFGQSVVLSHVFVVFLSDAHPGVADGPHTGEFPKSFSYLE
jgi:hypothetical protein